MSATSCKVAANNLLVNTATDGWEQTLLRAMEHMDKQLSAAGWQAIRTQEVVCELKFETHAVRTLYSANRLRLIRIVTAPSLLQLHVLQVPRCLHSSQAAAACKRPRPHPKRDRRAGVAVAAAVASVLVASNAATLPSLEPHLVH